MQSGYDISDLVLEAQSRWLKPAEVLFILQNYEDHGLTDKPLQKPASGSLFLFNKRVLRFFRKDGHSWRRKKDGRTVGEAHERLKVGNVEALNCYYAHGEKNPNFQRRSYWMLDLAYEHIVLVHYRDISVQSISSPGSVEVSSDVVMKSNKMNHLDIIERPGEVSSSSEPEISQALRRIEEQLSLNDERLNDESLNETEPFFSENENSHDSKNAVHDQSSRSAEMQDDSNNLVPQQLSDENRLHCHQLLEGGFTVESKETLTWREMLDYCESSPGVESQKEHVYTSDENGMPLPPSRWAPVEEQENSRWLNFGGNIAHDYSMFFHTYSPTINTYGTNPDYYTTLFDQEQIGMSLVADSSLTIAQKQKFKIREIFPEWGYASEPTKVIIIGSFLCDPSDCAWTCMFGDIEVPLQIIQEGVICCQAPPHLPGRVTFCITSGNRESCSEVRDFEYHVKPSSCAHCNLPETEASKSPEELSLLVRFAQILLSDSSIQSGEHTRSGVDLLGEFEAGNSWDQVIEALSAGTWTSSSTADWLLQELLKDKLQHWFSSRSRETNDQTGCSLSKKEQGIIHLIAGLGFVWALIPVLNFGVGVNFRDINGWTALHWAARFGREKMVAALIASGASAGAVTDPNSQDPAGKTPAFIAATCGHKGLAGYLSEVALTSHLSSLTLEESELSKSSADVEAETTVNSISSTDLVTNEDQLSLKDTLAAIRNATQAASRIQSAFRAHSFKKRQQKNAAALASIRIATQAASRIQSAFRAHSFKKRQQKKAAALASGDVYSIVSNDVLGLSAASKLAFHNTCGYNAAALSIQKKYRGWRGRKDFLTFRQKVVKIQAHVRGHQVRKNYKVCWAASILEKAILRWRRRGVGLRGFRLESESIDESEDEDILKLFRKQKVDVAIDEAVSRVLSMVESEEARKQYRRMLERYRQAKAEIERSLSEEAASTSQAGMSSMESDETQHFA